MSFILLFAPFIAISLTAAAAKSQYDGRHHSLPKREIVELAAIDNSFDFVLCIVFFWVMMNVAFSFELVEFLYKRSFIRKFLVTIHDDWEHESDDSRVTSNKGQALIQWVYVVVNLV